MTMRQFTLLGLVVLVSVLVWGWTVTRPTGVAEVVAFPRGGPTPDARYWITMQGDTYRIADGTLVQQVPWRAPSDVSANGVWIADTIGPVATTDPTPSSMYTVRLRRVDDPAQTWQIDIPLVTDRGLVVSNDGRLLAHNFAPHQNEGCSVYDARTGRLLFTSPERSTPPPVSFMAFVNDDHWFVYHQRDTVYIVDTTTWQEHTQIWSDYTKTAYLPRSKGLLLFDHFQLRLIRPATNGTLQITRVPLRFDAVHQISVSPDEQYAVLTKAAGGGSDALAVSFGELFGPRQPTPTQMALVRLEDGQIVQWFREPPGPGGGAVFTPDGRSLLTAVPHTGMNRWPIAPLPWWAQWLSTLRGRILPYW